jgi:hypothetical protein
MNAWVKQYLWLWTAERPTIWAHMLPLAEFAHNSWKHNISNKSPHKLLHSINLTIRIKTNDTGVPASTECLWELTEARKDTQKRLEKTQTHKITWSTPTLNPGSQVWLDRKNLHMQETKKLMPRQYGPFEVLKAISPVAYCIKLPPIMRIHDVFHIDLLTPDHKTAAYGMPYTWPPPIIENDEEEYKVESITNMQQHGCQCKLQYQVH